MAIRQIAFGPTSKAILRLSVYPWKRSSLRYASSAASGDRFPTLRNWSGNRCPPRIKRGTGFFPDHALLRRDHHDLDVVLRRRQFCLDGGAGPRIARLTPAVP